MASTAIPKETSDEEIRMFWEYTDRRRFWVAGDQPESGRFRSLDPIAIPKKNVYHVQSSEGREDMLFSVLASGSSGNASLIEMGGFGVLIDAGRGPLERAHIEAPVPPRHSPVLPCRTSGLAGPGKPGISSSGRRGPGAKLPGAGRASPEPVVALCAGPNPARR